MVRLLGVLKRVFIYILERIYNTTPPYQTETLSQWLKQRRFVLKRPH